MLNEDILVDKQLISRVYKKNKIRNKKLLKIKNLTEVAMENEPAEEAKIT